MKILVSPIAEKQLRKLTKLNQIVVAKKIRSLASESKIQTGQLAGYKNIFRVRIGDMRIVYKKSATTIFIILIGQRKDIYKKLQRLLR